MDLKMKSMAAAVFFIGVSLILYFLSTESANDSGSGGEATRRVLGGRPSKMTKGTRENDERQRNRARGYPQANLAKPQQEFFGFVMTNPMLATSFQHSSFLSSLYHFLYLD